MSENLHASFFGLDYFFFSPQTYNFNDQFYSIRWQLFILIFIEYFRWPQNHKNQNSTSILSKFLFRLKIIFSHLHLHTHTYKFAYTNVHWSPKEVKSTFINESSKHSIAQSNFCRNLKKSATENVDGFFDSFQILELRNVEIKMIF